MHAMHTTLRAAAACHLSQNSNLSAAAPFMRSTALHFLRGNRQREKWFWHLKKNECAVEMLKRAGIQTVKQCRHGKTKPRLQHKTGLNGQNGSGTYQSMAVECGHMVCRIGCIQCHWGGLVRFTVVGPVTSLIWNFNFFYEGRAKG